MSNCYNCGKESGKLFTSRSTGYLWCPKCLQAFVISGKTDETLFINTSEPASGAATINSQIRVNNIPTSNVMQTSNVTHVHIKGGKP